MVQWAVGEDARGPHRYGRYGAIKTSRALRKGETAMPKPVNQYIGIVDGWRRPSRQRNTAGRYQIAARDADQACEILKNAVGFGSVIIYDTPLEPGQCKNILPLDQCRKVLADGRLVPARHAGDPIEKGEREP